MSNILYEINRVLMKHPILFVGIIVIIILGNLLAALILNMLDALRVGNEIKGIELSDFSLLGIVGIVLGSLFFEAKLLGYKKSSLYHLINNKSTSSKTDIIYFIIACSGLMALLEIIFLCGLGYYISSKINEIYGFGLLQNSHPITQIIVQFIYAPFIFLFCASRASYSFFMEIS
jgi:hypothetical protein